jgi:hypothetical protein
MVVYKIRNRALFHVMMKGVLLFLFFLDFHLASDNPSIFLKMFAVQFFVHIQQSLIMCYCFRKLGRKFEILGCFHGPILDHLQSGCPIERRIYFYIIKNMRIIIQPLKIFSTRRIEWSFPRGVAPT